MMRPMKLGGEQILFGRGCLACLKQVPCQRAIIVTGGATLRENGILKLVRDYLESGASVTEVLETGTGEPTDTRVLIGAGVMKEWRPDLIVALGGGSVMDAAKAMWIFYENDSFESLQDIMPPHTFSGLRRKARMCCIPSTSGTASEVSRSIVITEQISGLKSGIGNMELIPDIAILDPLVTVSMSPRLTAETGMDALTHAIEALTSTRSNYLSNILAMQAVKDIVRWLPPAWEDGTNLDAREAMLNGSMAAGLAFTNVSLGIVHSMSHALGSFFKIPHGLANAVLLPFIIRYNREDNAAGAVYHKIQLEIGCEDLVYELEKLNYKMGIPPSFSELVEEAAYREKLPLLAKTALLDGCTRTNPVIPDIGNMERLFRLVYAGKEGACEWS